MHKRFQSFQFIFRGQSSLPIGKQNKNIKIGINYLEYPFLI